MKTRLIVPVLLSAVMFSMPAMATGKASPKGSGPSYPREHIAEAVTPATRCTELEAQFDQAVQVHEHAAMVSQAKDLRREAGPICAGGNHNEGITKLDTALRDIGVKPRYGVY
jgi:hypothetical protein